jgi:hypothetical protein
MYLSGYEFSQFYEIAVKKLLVEGLDKKIADEIAISAFPQVAKKNSFLLKCLHIFRIDVQ